MRKNIFLISSLRQPLKYLLLLVLVGAASFALVARAVEFIIVDGELRRIEGFFRSIGVLTPIAPSEQTSVAHNVLRAADEVVAASPLVAFDDRRYFVPGVLHDMMNVISGAMPSNRMNPLLEHIDSPALDQFVIVQLTHPVQFMPNFRGQPVLHFIAEMQEHVVADPGAMLIPRTFVNRLGQEATILSRVSFRMLLTQQEADMFRAGTFNPLEGLDVGDLVFIRASMHQGHPGPDGGGNAMALLRPLYGRDGLGHIIAHDPEDGVDFMSDFVMWVDPEQRDGDLVYFVRADDAAAMAAMREQIADEMQLVSDNLHTLMLTGTRDLSAMPRTLSPDTFLVQGRWLDYDDYQYARPVAVINSSMAARRGLRVGESFTITLRDTQMPPWMNEPTLSEWAWGRDGWWAPNPAGWWSVASELHTGLEQTMELEVVGVYRFSPTLGMLNNFMTTEVFVPLSVLPQGFGWGDDPLMSGMYSFVLTSPRNEDAFLAQAGPRLEALGFSARFLPNGFDIFAQSADPINTSIRINLVVYALASVLALALAVFLYLWPLRRSAAISRALGIPAQSVAGMFVVPAAGWLAAIAAGAWLAWRFALAQATQTLAEIGYGVDFSVSILWLVLIAGGIVLVTFGALGAAVVRMVYHPVLAQLQGSGARRQGIQLLKDSGALPQGFAPHTVLDSLSDVAALRTDRLLRMAATMRLCMRHILRSPVRTLLIGGFALFFVFSLGWLHNTIIVTQAEIERLYDETIITAHIVPDFLHDDVLPELDAADEDIFLRSPISQVTLDFVMDVGFVGEAHLTAVWPFSAFISEIGLEDWREGVMVPFAFTTFYGISSLDGFIEANTRGVLDDVLDIAGTDISIEWAPGFGPADFVFTDFSDYVPVLVRRNLLEETWDGEVLPDGTVVSGWGWDPFEPGATAAMWERPGWVTMQDGMPWSLSYPSVRTRIIGAIDGGMSTSIGAFDGVSQELMIVVMPLDAMRAAFEADMLWNPVAVHPLVGLPYMSGVLRIDPARNRELDDFRQIVAWTLANNELRDGSQRIPLSLMMDDRIFAETIQPMEQYLSLLQTLYPIALGAAVVLGMGLTMLLMLLNAKNAAVLRVLGKSKAKTRMMLCMEQIFVIITGALLAFAALVIFGQSVGLIVLGLGGLYVGATLVGLGVGAAAVCAKTPMELLQVRE